MKLRQALKIAIESSADSTYRIGVAAGVSQASLSRFLAGKRDLSLEAAEKLADYFRLHLVDDPAAKHPAAPTGEKKPARKKAAKRSAKK